MINKVVRFKGNTRFVPREAGNLYIDGDRAVIIDQAGREFVFARYGSDGQGGGSGDGSGGAEYVENWPENPVQNRLYVTSEGARVYYGSNGEYVEMAVSNGASQRPVYSITTIPPETTQYIVCDSVSDENNGSWQYVHEPSTYAIYVLPAVDDATVEHCAIVTVKFTESQSVAFVDQRDFDSPDPNFLPTITAVNDVEVGPGAVVEYLCKYDPLQSKWVITAAPMN